MAYHKTLEQLAFFIHIETSRYETDEIAYLGSSNPLESPLAPAVVRTDKYPTNLELLI